MTHYPSISQIDRTLFVDTISLTQGDVGWQETMTGGLALPYAYPGTNSRKNDLVCFGMTGGI